MAKQVINVGSSAGDGSGDALRDAMIKINANFTELYEGIVVQTIVGENGTTLVDISTNSVNANALTGTVPTGVATWDNLGGKPTSVAGFGIADAYTIAQTDAQIASEIDDFKISLAADGGDLKGSVFGDDSTLLVDGVSSTIPAANLSGTLPALDGNALTNIDAANITGTLPALDGSALTNIDAANITGSLSGVAVSTADITGYGVFTGTEESFATLTGATGTVAHDCDNGHIFYHTTPAADWTANFTNLGLTAEHATTLSIVISQGATAYIPTAVQIGGVAQTLLWQGGAQPTGTTNGTDVVSFSVLNDGGTYVVLGQLVDFA